MMGYGSGYGPGGYGGMMYGGGWIVGLMMLVFGILFIALVVVLILWAIRASHGSQSSQSSGAAVPPVNPDSSARQVGSASAAGHDEAVAIAKKRLANGEITAEQYAEIMRHLGS